MSTTVKVLEPTGILDSSKAEDFRKTVDATVAEGADILLLDLKDVTFIDSSGLGALVVILKQMRASKRKLYICSIGDQVRMLFELTSMDRVFEVFADREAFEAQICQTASAASVD